MSEPKLLSKIEFASFLIYSPRGQNEVSVKSRKVRDAIKHDAPGRIDEIVKRLSTETSKFPGWFGPKVSVIPMPRSSPFPKGPFITPATTLWVGKRICEALQIHGLAGEITPCLERTRAIKKSAYSAPGDRPSASEHYETLACHPLLNLADHILIVDDVITKGSTMLAAVSRVSEAFPNAKVRGFTLLRTMGLVPEVDKILDCCVGAITYQNGKVDREP